MRRVLVIDDDVAVAEVMRVVLEESNFRVSVAHDASEIPNERFDCIVADLVGVPVYSFDEARDWLSHLRERFPETPVVIVTAHADARADAARLGGRVLIKPFDTEDLVGAVREAAR